MVFGLYTKFSKLINIKKNMPKGRVPKLKSTKVWSLTFTHFSKSINLKKKLAGSPEQELYLEEVLIKLPSQTSYFLHLGGKE